MIRINVAMCPHLCENGWQCGNSRAGHIGRHGNQWCSVCGLRPKQYASRCQKCQRDENNQWLNKPGNRTHVKSLTRAWYWKNRTYVCEQAAAYRRAHPEVHRAANRRWYYAGKGRAYMRKYMRTRWQTDPMFRLKMNLRTRISDALRHYKKSSSMERLVGCSLGCLRNHLERQFLPGMSWENYGQWHVDHVRPCASFNLALPEEQRLCFHYTNLQPLWAVDNMRKGARY